MAIASLNATGVHISGKAVATLTTATWANSVAGDVIVVVVSMKGTTGPTSVKDNAGAGPEQQVSGFVVGANNGTTDRAEIYFIVSSVTGTNSVTVAFAATQTYDVIVNEQTGASPSPGATNSATGTVTGASVSVTTLNQGSWVVGGITNNGTATFTAGSGTTQRDSANTTGGSAASNEGGAECDNNSAVNTGTAVTLNETLSATGTWAFVGVELVDLAVNEPTLYEEEEINKLLTDGQQGFFDRYGRREQTGKQTDADGFEGMIDAGWIFSNLPAGPTLATGSGTESASAVTAVLTNFATGSGKEAASATSRVLTNFATASGKETASASPRVTTNFAIGSGREAASAVAAVTTNKATGSGKEATSAVAAVTTNKATGAGKASTSVSLVVTNPGGGGSLSPTNTFLEPADSSMMGL